MNNPRYVLKIHTEGYCLLNLVLSFSPHPKNWDDMEMELSEGNGQHEVEPDIDQQIEYVNHVRNHVVKHVKPLQGEIIMIRAIEQTLIAAKWLAWPDVVNRKDEVFDNLKKLTQTELRILWYVAQGQSPKAIANKLCVSPNTVNNHQYNIRKKMKLRGRRSLQDYAVGARSILYRLANEIVIVEK